MHNKKMRDKTNLSSTSPRPFCPECVMKHLGQASALFQECLQGYPEHRWLGIGHMAEAEAECQGSLPEFATRLRSERLQAQKEDYVPDLVGLMKAFRGFSKKAGRWMEVEEWLMGELYSERKRGKNIRDVVKEGKMWGFDVRQLKQIIKDFIRKGKILSVRGKLFPSHPEAERERSELMYANAVKEAMREDSAEIRVARNFLAASFDKELREYVDEAIAEVMFQNNRRPIELEMDVDGDFVDVWLPYNDYSLRLDDIVDYIIKNSRHDRRFNSEFTERLESDGAVKVLSPVKGMKGVVEDIPVYAAGKRRMGISYEVKRMSSNSILLKVDLDVSDRDIDKIRKDLLR